MAYIFLKTWGCGANKDNGSIIAGLLLEHGHELVQTNEDADLFIYNTCTVKGKTQDKILSDIRTVQEHWPDKKIIISGCMASAQTAFLKEILPGTSLVSLHNLTALPHILSDVLQGDVITLTARNKEVKLGLPKYTQELHTATIQIAEGCADACTFCITKLAKGHIFSFPKAAIIAEIQRLVQQGVTMIHLTSQDNGAYGIDTHKTSQLAALLREILALEGNFQIRLGMTNPRHIIPIAHDLVSLYHHPKLFKFLHIPVQAGSDNVLHAMNRKHSVADFKQLVTLFRTIPHMNIATDIICGYPGETEADFQQTLHLLQETKPEVVNISKFTPRPGTRAALLQPHTSQELKRRTLLTTQAYRTYSRA